MIVLASLSTDAPFADRLIGRWSMSADESHASARQAPSARYQSLLARAAIRALLFSHTAQSDWRFHADARGKLSVIDAAGLAGPAICVAHTRGAVACALTDTGAIGVDIETHRPRAYDAIAAWSFGARERAAVAAGAAAAFYRIWTLREAMGKATGEGLALATDRRDRADGGLDEGMWHRWIDEQIWLLGHFRTAAGLSLAVAALPGSGAIMDPAAVRWIDLAPLAEPVPSP